MKILRIRAALWRLRHVCVALALLAFGSAVFTSLSSLAPPRSPAIVLARDVPAGHRLASEDVSVVDIPDDIRPEGSVASVDDVVGQVSTAALPRGMPVTSRVFLSSEFLSHAPIGHTIVAVTVRADGVEEFLVPGARAAVYAPSSDSAIGAELVAPMAVISGIGGQKSGGGFMSRDNPDMTVYVAVPSDEAAGLLKYDALTPMRLVIHSSGSTPAHSASAPIHSMARENNSQ